MATDTMAMTFMRWNLPPMGSMYSAFSGRSAEETQGKYVSFQNYHLINISTCPTGPCGYEKATMFMEAYEQLSKKRRDMAFEWSDKDQPNDSMGALNICIQQSLPVFGYNGAFWDTDPDVLYITMIQLEASKRCPPLDEMKKVICGNIQFEDKLSLYYTTDYCDLVLFGRDIPCGVYQKALWSLIFDTGNSIRDTITFSCFSLHHYLERLEAIRHTEKDELSRLLKQTGDISISVDVSIKNESVWRTLANNIKKIRSAVINQISGRNDVRISFSEITEPQVFYILNALDLACEKGGIDIYEVIPQFAMEESVKHPNESPMRNNPKLLVALDKLHAEFLNAADKFYKNRPNDDKGFHQQIVFSAEVFRALYSLSKSGFADEFVLSVFPSLIEYTRLYRFLTESWLQPERLLGEGHLPNSNEIEQWKKREIEPMLEDIHREYIQSLSTLVQCTIHGERQFVQVPALNSPIFDVPPKLLALYSYMAYLITNTLNDSKNRFFSFIVVPDFRDDIYVSQISKCIEGTDAETGHPYNLLKINLNESLFYMPITLLSVLCHEIAHHVGGASRKRDLRAELFMRIVAMYIVSYSIPTVMVDGEESQQLPEKLAEIIGSELLRHYKAISYRPMRYFLTDVLAYIIDEQSFSYIFRSTVWKSDLIDAIYKGLVKYHAYGGKIAKEELSELAKLLDQNMRSNQVSMQYVHKNTRQAALYMMADYIVIKMAQRVEEIFYSANPSWGRSALNTWINCLYTFSESYSDLRMIELIGIDDSEDYDKLLLDYFGFNQDNMLLRIRQDSVKKAVWDIEAEPIRKNQSNIEKPMVNCLTYAENQIAEYLKKCQKDFEKRKNATRLRDFIDVLKSNDFDKVFQELDALLKEFKNSILDVPA